MKVKMIFQITSSKNKKFDEITFNNDISKLYTKLFGF